VTSPFAPVVRRARAIEFLLAVRAERLLTAVAGEMAIFRLMAAVCAGLLRAKTRLPARTAVPITEKNRLSLLTLDSAVAAALWRQISNRRAVRRAMRIIAVIADITAKIVVDLAAALMRMVLCIQCEIELNALNLALLRNVRMVVRLTAISQR
jgi:hypothetical protein